MVGGAGSGFVGTWRVSRFDGEVGFHVRIEEEVLAIGGRKLRIATASRVAAHVPLAATVVSGEMHRLLLLLKPSRGFRKIQ